MSTITERVAAGSAFLDQRCPLETYRCTPEASNFFEAFAGQLSAIPADNWTGIDTWARPLAFQAADDEYDALTTEWSRVITGRRSA